jgi:hypothetical protein
VQGLKDPAETVVSNGAFEPVTMTGDSHKGTSSTGQLVFEMLDPRGGGGSDRGNGSQSAATGRFGDIFGLFMRAVRMKHPRRRDSSIEPRVRSLLR